MSRLEQLLELNQVKDYVKQRLIAVLFKIRFDE